MSELGAVGCVVEAIKLFPKDSEILENGFATLANLAPFHFSIKDIMGKYLVPQLILMHININSSHEVLIQATRALGNICYGHRINRDLAYSCNAIQTILGVFENTLEDNPQVLQWCCHALRNLTFNHSDIQQAIIQNICTELLIQSLNIHKTHEKLHQFASSLVGSLSYSNYITKTVLVEKNALSAILYVSVERFPNSANVQEAALMALALIVDEHKDNQQIVEKESNLQLIIQNLQRMVEHIGVAQWGLRLLIRLSTDSTTIARRISEYNGTLLAKSIAQHCQLKFKESNSKKNIDDLKKLRKLTEELLTILVKL